MPKNGETNVRSLVHPLDGVKDSVPDVGHADSRLCSRSFPSPWVYVYMLFADFRRGVTFWIWRSIGLLSSLHVPFFFLW